MIKGPLLRTLTSARTFVVNQLPHWTLPERVVFLALAIAVVILSFLYCFHSGRLISPDEIGLHNPVYMYETTGKMTYPVHQYPLDTGMYVHPPTNYWITALGIKLLGVDVMPASALPIFLLTILIIATLYLGQYEFPVAAGALLAFFITIYVFSYFFTLRPDVHTSAAWVAGLLMMQSARNRDWAYGRLFLGAAICTYAGMEHYWGTLSFTAVGVYAVYFIATSKRERWLKGLATMAAGGAVVGLPYLILFVIPQYENIRAITSAVQGEKDWRDAYDRHMQDYKIYAAMLGTPGWPKLSLDGLQPRWLLGLLLGRTYELSIPLLCFAVPLLSLKRQTRVLGIAGLALPLTVMFYAQGKGYDYYLPEVFLYLFACITVVLAGLGLALRLISSRMPSSARLYLGAALPVFVIVLSVVAAVQVPTGMGTKWQFTRHMDMPEVNRAAARDIFGPNIVAATSSVDNWYIAGGAVTWSPTFHRFVGVLPGPEASTEQLQDFFAPADYFAEILGIWWGVTTDAVPANLWYIEGKMSLMGFIFNEPSSRALNQIFLAPGANRPLTAGFVIDSEKVQRFTPNANGRSVFEVLMCDSYAAVARPQGLDGYDFFPVTTVYGDTGPHLVLMLGKEATVAEARKAFSPAPVDEQFPERVIQRSAKSDTNHTGTTNCMTFEQVKGDLEEVDRAQLRKASNATERPIKFTANRMTTFAARSLVTGRPLPAKPALKIAANGTGLRFDVASALPSGVEIVVEASECSTCPWAELTTLREATTTLDTPANTHQCFRGVAREVQSRLEGEPGDVFCRPKYGAEWRSTLLPATFTVGQPNEVSFQVLNTGTHIWRPDVSDLVFLVYRWFPQGCVGKALSEMTFLLPRTVTPGETVDVTTKIMAPAKPGIYCLEYDLGHYGYTYFSTAGSPGHRMVIQVR